MSTRKDGIKAANQNIPKKKTTSVSKTSTRKREESTDRGKKKTEETAKKTKPLVTNPKDDSLGSSRVKPAVKSSKPQVLDDSRKNTRTVARVIKKTGVPVTPPSNRVSKTQFFPSKNMYSNALKSDQTTNKVVASSSGEVKKRETDSEVKKREILDEKSVKKSVNKNIINGKSSVKKIVNKESMDRNTFRAQKTRETSPDTSSTSERPRTATLRKGSIVNGNIVGPDAPKPVVPKVIKEVIKPDSPEIEEYNYEDDFESYESDFEECSSSSESIGLNDISGEETSSVSSSSKSRESPRELTSVKKRIFSAGTEDDRKLDSGNFDMPDYKHRQILDNIKESVEKENAALKIREVQRNNPASLSDEGFEEQKSLQFINFLGAKKKCEHRKSVELKRKRGEQILNMIRLDSYSFTLFDLPSVPYETFIKNYGRSNTVQTAVQTGEDDIDETVQTEEILSESKWTQLPIHFPTVDVKDPNYLQICKSSYLGVGGDNFSEEKSKNIVNELGLKKFLSSTGGLILRIQEESRLEHYQNVQKNSRDIPFSAGYISFDTSQGFLKNSSVNCVSFPSDSSNKFMTVHLNKMWGSDGCRSMICVWSISNCDGPECYFISYGNVSCCSFGERPSDYIYAGLDDGTISVWNTKRSIYNEDSHLKRTPLHTTNVGVGHKSEIVSLQPFVSCVEGSSQFHSHQTNEICSLDEIGDVILWSLITKNTPNKDSITNSTSWDDVILTRNTKVSLKALYPELEDLQCTDCVLNSKDSNYIIVSTNYGFIIHHLIKGGRSNVKKFVPASQSCANCLEACPFSPVYFLAGFSDGNINLYSRLVEKPLMVLSDKEGECGTSDIRSIQWSKSKPFVIYSKDASNTIHVWDLNESDMYPIYSIPFEKNITCMKLSPLLEDDHMKIAYMIIGTNDGNLYLHLLNSEHGQQPYTLYKEHVNTFLKYVNRL